MITNQILRNTNPLFQFAKSGKRTTNFFLIMFLIWTFFICNISFMRKHLQTNPFVTENPLLNESILSTLQLIGYFFPLIILVALWVIFYEKRDFATLGFFKENAFQKYLEGLFIGIFMLCLLIIFISIFGYYAWETDQSFSERMQTIFPVFIILFGYCIQGASEEILFRGWLMNEAGARFKPWVGILISSIFFGLTHVLLNRNVNILSFLNISLCGIFLSLYALRQESLWGPCAWHSIWNWLEGNFFGLEVSGAKETVSIFSFQEIGPDWITGGKFGPEGGILCTSILLFGISFCFIRSKSKV